jgi:hypothetical protein
VGATPGKVCLPVTGRGTIWYSLMLATVRLPLGSMRIIVILTVACICTITPVRVRAQEQGLGSGQDPSPDDVLEGFVTRSDYFTANSDPKTKRWLFLVELGHANERVWKLYHAGNYKDALADAQYTLARFPNHPRALNLVAEIGKVTNDISMPIPYFELALKYYPQHAFTHAQYGHYLVGIGAVNAGAAELLEALLLDPNQLQAQAWLNEVPPELRKVPGP